MITAVASDSSLEALASGRIHDPHHVLGLKRERETYRLRAVRPDADALWLRTASGFAPMQRLHECGIFEWTGADAPPRPVLLRAERTGQVWEFHDPYGFAPAISADDLYLFNEGTMHQAYRLLGSHAQTREGVSGIRFACWAPNAERVSVVGEFNGWDGRAYPMSVHSDSGVWEVFVPGLQVGALYKFEIRNRASGEILIKTDPYAQAYEFRPGTAARA
ncbi:MAG TPA: 1,4-alpha-glucan branching enzyme, partial [Burkholderiales bacterium]|nr:1,4-alpha-glucan branching enzyme [Burkholderiales bacterium]